MLDDGRPLAVQNAATAGVRLAKRAVTMTRATATLLTGGFSEQLLAWIRLLIPLEKLLLDGDRAEAGST
jgi:hypothetical protein